MGLTSVIWTLKLGFWLLFSIFAVEQMFFICIGIRCALWHLYSYLFVLVPDCCLVKTTRYTMLTLYSLVLSRIMCVTSVVIEISSKILSLTFHWPLLQEALWIFCDRHCFHSFIEFFWTFLACQKAVLLPGIVKCIVRTIVRVLWLFCASCILHVNLTWQKCVC